ncbi:MAG: phage portal protein [Oenococcus sp.]|uniref:phage portal protein n=1 Tax=Oenococcus sp. TaxID=1979414 RepID=UPI0039E90143
MSDRIEHITDLPNVNGSTEDYYRIQRWLQYLQGNWGKTKHYNAYGQEFHKQKIALNMAEKATEYLSTLIFNDGVSISVSDKATDNLIQQILNDNHFYRVFGEKLQAMYALGGIAIKPTWNDVTQSVELTYIMAPNCYPLASDTQEIDSMVFAYPTRQVESGVQYTYTRVEYHYWTNETIGGKNQRVYNIHNELYKALTSDQDDHGNTILGNKIPLNSLDKYADMLEDEYFDNLTKPLFLYMKPAGLNSKNLNSPLGKSIYADSLPTLEAINDVYDAFHWEVQMARTKVAVTGNLLQFNYVKPNPNDPTHPTSTAPDVFFPKDEDVFQFVGGDDQDMKIQPLNTPLRSADFTATIQQYLKTLEMELGFSAGTFTFDGQAIQTATAITSQNAQTYRTRQRFINDLSDNIKTLIDSIIEIYNLNNTQDFAIPGDDQITVSFDDGIFEDKNDKFTFWSGMQNQSLVSRLTALMKITGMNEDDAQAELDKVDSENPVPNTDSNLGGSDFDNNDEGTPADTSDQYGFSVGEVIKVNADHMPGMQGSIGVIDDPPAGTPAGVYMIDYQPTDGSPIVKNHKWVDNTEIEAAPAGTKFNGQSSSMSM